MSDISKEYASALFILATEQNNEDEVFSGLSAAAEAFSQNPEYYMVLESPAIPLSERLGCLDAAFSSLPEYVLSLMKLMCENGHMREFCECAAAFEDLLREAEKRTVATVFYVHEPTEEQKARLLEKLSAISGKKVEAVYVKDESLLGGIKVQYDDRVLDGSISGNLNKIKEVISE